MEEEKQNQISELKSGIWEGRYLDAYGYKGNLRLEFETGENKLEGKYSLELITEDEPEVISGRIGGNYEKNMVRIELISTRSKEPILYEGKLVDAGSHATQCMKGLVDTTPENNFGGGVWILWRYKKSNQ